MPGITATTVSLGLIYPDLAALQKIGLALDVGDSEQIVQVFVDAANAHDEFCGRELVVDAIATFDQTVDGSDVDACTKVTQDKRPAIVLANSTINQTPALCIAAGGKTILVANGEMTRAAFDQAEGRLFTTRPYAEEDLAATVAYAEEAGLLTDGVGLFYGSDDPSEGETVEATVIPALKAAGVDPVTCRMTRGAGGETGTTESDLCIEKFATAGVKTVFMSTDLFSTLLARQAATASGFDATWIGGSFPSTTNLNAGPLLFKAFGGQETMEGSIGVTADQQLDQPTAQDLACLDTFKAAVGEAPEVGSPQATSIIVGCFLVNQIADAVTRAGINPTQEDLIAGFEQAGQLTMPGGTAGEWSATRHAASQEMQVVQYSKDCICYQTIRGFAPIAG